ncbi:MAG: S41 family peptidase [Acidobacteria bacterium]|nr:S41 family peptidase [Acidobacteriota bacterium]
MRFTVVALTIFAAVLPAQPPPEKDLNIEAAERNQAIDAVLDSLNKRYVFPEVASKMESDIRERQKRKEYDAIISAREFARVLTENLQAVSHDKHLRVRHSFDVIPQRPQREGPPPPEEVERARKQMAKQNFGFEKVERLNGNIGYLDLRGFLPAGFVGETAVAAMNLLANSDAVIIDVRKNGGGDPATVALITSYLFDDVTHLNDLYFRPNDSTRQWWTLPYVPGRKLAGKPVYVLTSKRTFSAAEEFTYNLKNLKRATIVGETTGGGAHPGGGARLSDHFSAFIPSGRAINPVSKTNWEGTGVEPDVKVDQELALKTAHLLAVKKVREAEKDQRLVSQLGEVVLMLEKELSAQKQ